jgi:ubiquinone/menaquinone biosynthesis C-methylase UbiE
MNDAGSTHSSVRVTYDSLAWRYDAAIRPCERLFLSRLRERTVAALPAGGQLLEVGAGTGLNFSYLQPETRGVASELSRAMIRQAEKKSRPRAVSLIQANIEALPFPDDYFDAALSTLLFCSVASVQKSFSELRRVVRADGTIVMLEHVRPPGILGPVFDLLSRITVPLCEDHFNRRTALEARRAGFEIQSIERAALGIFNIIVLRKSLESLGSLESLERRTLPAL